VEVVIPTKSLPQAPQTSTASSAVLASIAK
jgi:hypothetical protein